MSKLTPLLFLILCLTACKDGEKITVYTIPKETSTSLVPNSQPPTAAPMAGQQMPGLADQTSAIPTPSWTAPDSWQTQPLGSMRKGSFLFKEEGREAEITVLAFPGDVGGNLANINRWASQVNAPQLTQANLDALETLEVDFHGALIVHLTGPEQSVYAAIIEHAGNSYFFKIMGPSDLVCSQIEPFRLFLQSLSFPK